MGSITKTLSEMVEDLELDIDISAVEDEAGCETDSEYRVLRTIADSYYTAYSVAKWNYKCEWHWILYNWNRSRLTDRRHFECILDGAKFQHKELKRVKPLYMEARAEFEAKVRQIVKEWEEVA